MRGLAWRSVALGGLLGLVWVAPLAAAPDRLPPQVLPFIQDDYPGALAQARAKGLPLFVEAWAPW